jgi:hypothetical protein
VAPRGQAAAAELQEHVRLISGETLPLVNDADKVTGLRILIGDSKASHLISCE